VAALWRNNRERFEGLSNRPASIGRKEVAYSTNRSVIKQGVTQNQRTEKNKVAAGDPQQKPES